MSNVHTYNMYYVCYFKDKKRNIAKAMNNEYHFYLDI